MPVYERGGTLWISFYYLGVRCRETLGVPDTKGNMAYAKRKDIEIKGEIAMGTFNYAHHFPESTKCKLFGEEAKPEITLEEAAKTWLEQQQKLFTMGQRKSTRHYVSHTERIILPKLGHLPMRNIKRHHIEDFICSLSGKSAKYINNILIPLRQIFRDAFEREHIDTNIMERIRNPKVDKPDIVPFNDDEVDAILAHMREHHPREHPFFAIMFETGMRTGEVLAMKWDNVDFRRQVYYVRESISQRKLGTPKTSASAREVALTDVALGMLVTERKRKIGSGFIFTGEDNQPWSESAWLVRHVWRPTLRQLGIAYRWPYQCRHTFAIRALNAGMKPEHVARQLGHSSLQMLFQRYARWTSDCGIDVSVLNRGHNLGTIKKPRAVTLG